MLTFDNLKILSSTNQASVKAKILVSVISKEYIRVESDLYKINEEFIWRQLTETD